MTKRELTTTAYVILGLLAVQPWTAYQLKQQVERGPAWFWPRSGNKLYGIPKDLVARGYATATPGAKGRRPRTVYEITDRGREALAAWLGEPSRPPTLEAEALVRVLFADQGDGDALRETIRSFLDHIAAIQGFGGGIGEEYRLEGGPFPERLHVNALIFELMWRYTEALRAWGEWALSEIARWDGTGPQPQRQAELLQRYDEVADVVAARTPKRSA